MAVTASADRGGCTTCWERLDPATKAARHIVPARYIGPVRIGVSETESVVIDLALGEAVECWLASHDAVTVSTAPAGR